ncbi:MAG: hypothetical protein ACOC97_01825 [Myxococcota bacterium]
MKRSNGWTRAQGAACAVLILGPLSLAACASGTEGGSDPADGGPDSGRLPQADGSVDGGLPEPVAIETVLSSDTIAAGQRVNATCRLLDEDGEPTAVPQPEYRISHEPSQLFGEDEDGHTIGRKVGEGAVRCTLPSLGLTDDTPAPLTVTPGPARTVVTELSKSTSQAGEGVDATCRAYDDFGNELVDFESSVAVSPSGAGVDLEEKTLTITRSDLYEVTCSVDGADEQQPAVLFVEPGLPASITVGTRPEPEFFAIGDQVTVLTTVRDAHGNEVTDATLAYEANPSAPLVADARFLLDAEGTVRLTATVTSPTEGGAEVRGYADVLVNSQGPAIECLKPDEPEVPSDAFMIHASPGGALDFLVRASDAFGVDTVTINGEAASVDGDGHYARSVPVAYGMNFVEVVATDTEGEENSKICTFLASDRWSGEDALIDGAVSLRLDQAAVDDGDAGDIDSLNDVVVTALNSMGIAQTLNDALVAMNPLYDDCIQEVCLLGCTCVASATLDYRDGSLSLGGPNTSSLQLVDDGLRMQLAIRNMSATFDVGGTCSGSPTISIAELSADVTFDISASGGAPSLSVRSVNSISVGDVSTSCSFSFPCDILCSLLRGTLEDTIRSELQNQLEGIVRDQLGPLLDDALQGLDVSSLGSTFSVPTLDGSGTVDLDFGVDLSDLDASSSRLLLGLAAGFSPQEDAHARESLGVALRQGTIWLDPPGTSPSSPAAVALYEGALNQILHGLWRGGFLQGSLALGGGSATIDAKLPPLAVLDGDQVKLMLGGVRASVVIPDLGGEPLDVTFGGVATADVSLDGEDLSFGNVSLEPGQLFVSFDEPLDNMQRQQLESFLTSVLQNVLGDAINDGLPAIPIPSFALPDDFSEFGFPVGSELGITNPMLGQSGQHFVLTGGFGLK